MKNYIEHQISQQQVGNQKVDRITFVLSIVIVSTAIYIWGDFLPQASTSLDYAKNIVFVGALISPAFNLLFIRQLDEIRKNQFCLQ